MKIVIIIVLLAAVLASSSPTGDRINRIVNGFPLDITEVPYQASLRRKVSSGWAHMCGAVVVTVKSALTAAHCVNTYMFQPNLLKVVVGTSHRSSGGTAYDLEYIYVHEEYSSLTLEHDIALITTSKIISVSKSVVPIKFAEYGFELAAGTEALVTGYGVTSYEGSASQTLQGAKVRVVSQNSCSTAYMRIASISVGMVCASATDPPRDACQGDSGGPLVAQNKLVGIVSWGEGCANASYPGVYTRVSNYSKWIYGKLAIV